MYVSVAEILEKQIRGSLYFRIGLFQEKFTF